MNDTGCMRLLCKLTYSGMSYARLARNSLVPVHVITRLRNKYPEFNKMLQLLKKVP